MENNNNTHGNQGLFSFLYRFRIMVRKNDVTVINLSLLFSIITLLLAPWIVLIGFICSLVLGYRFSVDRNSECFNASLQDVYKNAAENAKQTVGSMVNDQQE